MPDVLRPADAASARLSRRGLYRAVHAGRLDRVARGVYREAAATPAEWEWVEAAARRPDATVCLASALAFHDLTDAIPDRLSVALPRGARRPATQSAIEWHLFDATTFDIGRTQVEVPGSGQLIGMYSAERSIVDAFRLRGQVGYDLGLGALREWLRRGGKPAALVDIAEQLPRSLGPLRLALETLT